MGHLLSFRQVLSCPVGSGSRNRSVDSAEATTALLAANWFALEDQQRGESAVFCKKAAGSDGAKSRLCTGVPAVPNPFFF